MTSQADSDAASSRVEPLDTDIDLLASPTLALLYLAQGHLTKTRRVLATLDRIARFRGAAAALSERLALLNTATLRLRVTDGAVIAHWATTPRDNLKHTHLVCVFVERGGAPDPVPTYRSQRCAIRAGSAELYELTTPGWLSAALIEYAAEHSAPRVLAVAGPVSW